MSTPVPDPVPDKENSSASVESRLSELLLSQSKEALRFMLSSMDEGWNPIRSMRIIENYAASTRHHLSELVAEPLESDDPFEEDGGVILGYNADPGGYGNHGFNRRLRRNRRQNGQGVDHGGGVIPGMGDMVETMVEEMSPIFDKLSRGKDRSARIKDLTAAIASSREIGDEHIEAQLREELDVVLSERQGQEKSDASEQENVIEAEFEDAEEVRTPQPGDTVISSEMDGYRRYKVERFAERDQVKISPLEDIEGVNTRFVSIENLFLQNTNDEYGSYWMEQYFPHTGTGVLK